MTAARIPLNWAQSASECLEGHGKAGWGQQQAEEGRGGGGGKRSRREEGNDQFCTLDILEQINCSLPLVVISTCVLGSFLCPF